MKKTARTAFVLMCLLSAFTTGYSQEPLVYGTINGAATPRNLADFSGKDTAGYTPLMLAAINGNLDMVKVLVEKGADVNVRAEDGLTALELAKVNRHPDVVEFLKQHGAKEFPAGNHAP